MRARTSKPSSFGISMSSSARSARRRAQFVERGRPVRRRHDGRLRRRQVGGCELAQRRIVVDDKNADRLFADVGPAGLSNLGHAVPSCGSEYRTGSLKLSLAFAQSGGARLNLLYATPRVVRVRLRESTDQAGAGGGAGSVRVRRVAGSVRDGAIGDFRSGTSMPISTRSLRPRPSREWTVRPWSRLYRL